PPAPSPLATPGQDLEIPEGLDRATADALRLALNALRPPVPPGAMTRDMRRLWHQMATSGLRSLPGIVADAPEGSRARVRDFVVERLAGLVGQGPFSRPALDAGIALAEQGALGLGPLVTAARKAGLGDDDSAAAALAFLGSLEEPDATVGAAISALADDADRPLHLRVLARAWLRDHPAR
ncbi:MAG: hypothetical protein ACC662_10640, partial [Planctomycetota bacterium]